MHIRTLLIATFAAIGLLLSTQASTAQAPAPAPKPLIISSGGATGTYFRLVRELMDACPGINAENRESSGALANIDQILNNKAELGITQNDALFLRAQREEAVKNRIYTLFPLHLEEIHLIVKTTTGRVTGGTNVPFVGNIGGTNIALETIQDLKGLKVGFWGGSAVTEKVINSLALISWIPVEYGDQTKAFDALSSGNINAILAVGGQPLGWVEKLDRTYKLLSIPDQVAKMLDAVYGKTTLTYRNLGQDGVQTVGVDALLVTRNYTSATMVARLKAVRECAAKQINEIRETRDTHPKWVVIDPSKDAKWQMFPPAK